MLGFKRSLLTSLFAWVDCPSALRRTCYATRALPETLAIASQQLALSSAIKGKACRNMHSADAVLLAAADTWCEKQRPE